MSQPYAEVIGDPIAHSKSPLIHNFWLKTLGMEAEYRACHVTPDALADYIAQRRADPAGQLADRSLFRLVHQPFQPRPVGLALAPEPLAAQGGGGAEIAGVRHSRSLRFRSR